jgi:hypothetical protein
MISGDEAKSASKLLYRASTLGFNNGSGHYEHSGSALEKPSTTRFDSSLEDHHVNDYPQTSGIRFSGCEEDRAQRLFVSLHDSLFEFETVVREDITKAQQTGVSNIYRHLYVADLSCRMMIHLPISSRSNNQN